MKQRTFLGTSVIYCLSAMLVEAAAAQQPPANPGAFRDTTSEQTDYRQRLESRGVAIGFSYTAETFSVLQGGAPSRRPGEYLGSFVSTLTLDLGSAGFGRGRVFFSAQSLHGRGVNDSRIGAAQALSNLDSTGFAKFIEAWYGDSYWNGRVNIKAGQQYADTDFGVVEIGSDFLNSSCGLNPTIPMPSFPRPELGASVWIAPTSWLSWGAGVFKGGEGETLSETAAPLKKSPFTIIEAKLQPLGNQSPWRGTYRVGVWRQVRASSLSTTDTVKEPVRNAGIYVAADQWFAQSPEGRGPGVFFQWGWTPPDRNEITRYTGAGVAYRGLLTRRPADTFGLGLIRASLAAVNPETAIELFYQLQLTDNLRIQPDIQWIRHPASQGRNTLAAGLRVGLDF